MFASAAFNSASATFACKAATARSFSAFSIDSTILSLFQQLLAALRPAGTVPGTFALASTAWSILGLGHLGRRLGEADVDVVVGLLLGHLELVAGHVVLHLRDRCRRSGPADRLRPPAALRARGSSSARPPLAPAPAPLRPAHSRQFGSVTVSAAARRQRRDATANTSQQDRLRSSRTTA